MELLKWLFGPGPFEKAAEAQMGAALASTLYYDTQVKRYTMADGSVHFRAFLIDRRNVSLGDVAEELPIWQTNSRQYMYGVYMREKDCVLTKVAQFSNYEDARDAADSCAVRHNRNLKCTTVVNIEDV